MSRRHRLALGLVMAWSATVTAVRADDLTARWVAAALAVTAAWLIAFAVYPRTEDR